MLPGGCGAGAGGGGGGEVGQLTLGEHISLTSNDFLPFRESLDDSSGFCFSPSGSRFKIEGKALTL